MQNYAENRLQDLNFDNGYYIQVLKHYDKPNVDNPPNTVDKCQVMGITPLRRLTDALNIVLP